MRRFITYSLLAGSLSLAGCGGGSASNPAAAKGASGSAAVASDVLQEPVEQLEVQLEGTWRGTMIVNDEAANKMLKAPQIEALKAMQMTMVFRDDGTLQLAGESDGKPYQSENKWDLVIADGNKLTIKSTDADGKAKNIDLFFNDSKSFDMPLSTEVADLGAMRFTRVH